MAEAHDFSFYVSDLSDPTDVCAGRATAITGRRGARVFEASPCLRYVIDYPLEPGRAQQYEHVHEMGPPWTRAQFAERRRLDYESIYAQADDFGVWGHGIEDLVFEGAERQPDGAWRLDVGS